MNNIKKERAAPERTAAEQAKMALAGKTRSSIQGTISFWYMTHRGRKWRHMLLRFGGEARFEVHLDGRPAKGTLGACVWDRLLPEKDIRRIRKGQK